LAEAAALRLPDPHELGPYVMGAVVLAAVVQVLVLVLG
jgi:hypothetical protein